MATTLDWKTVRPVPAVVAVHGYVDLPAFTVAGLVWKGASDIVKQYNYTASKRFVLRNRPAKPEGCNYGLAIRYRRGTTVYRYKLWDDDDLVLQAPLYSNHIIYPNFVLEAWSLNAATEASQATALRLTTGIQEVVTDFSVAPADYELSVGADAGDLALIPVPPPSAPLSTGLQAWYKADAGVSWTSGRISGWADQSGNARNLAQGVAGQRPLMKFTGFGDTNLPQIWFTLGAGENLASGVLAGFPVQHVYLALKPTDFNAGDGIIDVGTFSLAMGATPGNLRVTFGIDTVDAAYTDDADVILAVTFDMDGAGNGLAGITITDLQGGNAVSADGATLQAVVPATAITIGPAAMRAAEILAYDTPQSEADNTSIMRYLASRYVSAPSILPVTVNPLGPWLDNP